MAVGGGHTRDNHSNQDSCTCFPTAARDRDSRASKAWEAREAAGEASPEARSRRKSCKSPNYTCGTMLAAWWDRLTGKRHTPHCTERQEEGQAPSSSPVRSD